jgi:hypothetical protein
LRLGWPNGLRRAGEALDQETMGAQLICGVFEDIFPANSELDAVLKEIDCQDYEGLCARETHHGRGYTDKFCPLAEEGMQKALIEEAEL